MYRTTVVEDASIDTTPLPALTPAMADLPTATALPALASADVAPLARPVIPALTGIRGWRRHGWPPTTCCRRYAPASACTRWTIPAWWKTASARWTCSSSCPG
ncbi:hypothetical protein RAA17_14170 [Komagataeibacter rhaeticus]|nr:hypothetical protein [Komagataeibacter rhaeticus]